MEEHILSIVLQSKDPAKKIKEIESIIELKKLPAAAASKILLELKNNATEDKFEIDSFINKLNKELIPVADKAYMLEISSDIRSKLRKSVKELRLLLLRQELKEKSAQLKKIEKSGADSLLLNKLNKKIADLTKKIKDY